MLTKLIGGSMWVCMYDDMRILAFVYVVYCCLLLDAANWDIKCTGKYFFLIEV